MERFVVSLVFAVGTVGMIVLFWVTISLSPHTPAPIFIEASTTSDRFCSDCYESTTTVGILRGRVLSTHEIDVHVFALSGALEGSFYTKDHRFSVDLFPGYHVVRAGANARVSCGSQMGYVVAGGVTETVISCEI